MRIDSVLNFLSLIKKDINDLLNELLMAKNVDSEIAVKTIIETMRDAKYPIVILNTIYPLTVFKILITNDYNTNKCLEASRTSLNTIWKLISDSDKKYMQSAVKDQIAKCSLNLTKEVSDVTIRNIQFLNQFLIQ
jgi:hypothetical protein